jgi:hypothetical protein
MDLSKNVRNVSGTESVITKKSPLENYFCSGHKGVCFKVILVFAQLSTSTASRPSISGLSTKTLTSTLDAIIYYFVLLQQLLMPRKF